MKKSMFMVMSAAMLAIGSSGLAFSAYSPAFSTLSADQPLMARGGDDTHPEDTCRHGACAADQLLLAKQSRGGHDDGPEPETPGVIS